MGSVPASTFPIGYALGLLRSGRTADALAVTAQLVREAPGAAEAHHVYALALAASGDDARADAAFRQAARIAPGDAGILMNHAVLLRRTGRLDAAVAQLQKLVDRHPQHAQGWLELGQTRLRLGDAHAACAALERSLRLDPTPALGWHLLGNACRDTGRLEEAERAFRACLERDARQWTASLNLACVLRLTGRPDEAAAIHARLIAQGHGTPQVLDAYVGALADTGDTGNAIAVARRTVHDSPDYVAAHVTLAHLLWEHGEDAAEAIATFRSAVDARPGDHELRAGFARWLIASGHADDAVEQARILRRAVDDPALLALEADALEAAGRTGESGPLYRELVAHPGGRRVTCLNAYARHLLRARDAAAAARVAEQATSIDPHAQEAWAYLGTAWRLTGDPRESWLCDTDRLVGVLDIGFPVEAGAGCDELRSVLDLLHRARREPRQQSVRGGTQTAGRLLQRRDPVLAAMRRHLLAAVEHWLAGLPVVPGHPFLGRNTRAVTLGGSWSVRLASAGAHTDHVHPEGWISSAYYVALPPSVREHPGDSGPGCLRFGQPPVQLGLDLPPRRTVRPEEGRLVLFPSYMWHGTTPFQDASPRLTIAFDMTPAGVMGASQR